MHRLAGSARPARAVARETLSAPRVDARPVEPPAHGSEALAARLALFSEERRGHAGSLIVSLFADLGVPRGGRIWLGSLIRLLAPLGLSERLVRTTVFRLVREQWLRAEAIGRRSDYLLTATGQRRCADAERRIYASHAPAWDRRWRLLLVLGTLPARDREALRRALFWRGFGALGRGCFVHPGADLAAAVDDLVGDGLAHLLPSLLPLLAADASLAGSASNADLIARAWDLGELAHAYDQFVAKYKPVLAQLRAQQLPADDEQACLLRLLLIQDYRRVLLRDPQLPELLLPLGWSGTAARALCRELYRRLLVPSERHLDAVLATASGRPPPQQALLRTRFPDDDPLPVTAR